MIHRTNTVIHHIVVITPTNCLTNGIYSDPYTCCNIPRNTRNLGIDIFPSPIPDSRECVLRIRTNYPIIIVQCLLNAKSI